MSEGPESRVDSEDQLIISAVKDFGEQLKQTRTRLGFTQEELASRLGVKRQTLSSWEQGDTTPEVKTILKLREIAKSKAPLDLGELLGQIKWDSGDTPLAFSIDLLRTIEESGIRNVYRNRTGALDGFYQVLEKETKSVGVVCSSFMGVIRVAPQKVSALLERKAKVVDWRIIMTDPELSEGREKQEGRLKGSIRLEILESVKTLLKWGIPKESIRFYSGTPTVFMLLTPERAILNPYTYGAEAFKTFTLEVAKTDNPDDIYNQYVTNHFARAWDHRNVKSVSEILDAAGDPA